MDYFNDFLNTFQGLEYGSSVVVYAGHKKSINLCSKDEQRFYGFDTITDRISIIFI